MFSKMMSPLVGLTLCFSMLLSGQFADDKHSNAHADGAFAVLTVDHDPFTAADQLLEINYTLTSVGDVSAEFFELFHSLSPDRICRVDLLSPGFAVVCTAVYKTTAADVAAGQIPVDVTAGLIEESFVIPFVGGGGGASDMDLSITATPASFTTAGTQITYDYKVTNNAAGELTGISIEDPLTGGTVCSNISLSPTFSATCTQVYTTTAADVTNGGVTNTATASANETGDATASATVPVGGGGGMTGDIKLTGGTTTASYSGPYEFIVLNYEVMNTSAGDVNDITVNFGDGSTICVIGNLAPGVTASCTGVYMTTPADGAATGISIMAIATYAGSTSESKVTTDIPRI